MTTPYLILGDEPYWSAPVWEFDAVLERTAAQLAPEEPAHELLELARRRGSADLRRMDRAELAHLLEAVHTAYVRMVRVWRAGFPDDRHADVLPHLGRLAQRLEAAVPEPVERWSLRRLQAFGGAIDACFPGELSRALLPLIREDAARAEHVLRVLRDRDIDEDASAIAGAAFLPGGRNEAFLLECARHRREAVRFTLFKLLSGGRALPDPGSLTTGFSDDTITGLLRAGITDPSPRVRERAIAYGYGIGRVAAVRAELIAALSPATLDPDETCRAYELLALGVLDGADTLALLTRAFEHGAPVEATAATWALARRPDGIARVVAAVDDPRPEIRPEAIGAIMHVSGPLAAEHAAWLASPDRAPDVRQAVEHNQRRGGIPDPASSISVTTSTLRASS